MAHRRNRPDRDSRSEGDGGTRELAAQAVLDPRQDHRRIACRRTEHLGAGDLLDLSAGRDHPLAVDRELAAVGAEGGRLPVELGRDVDDDVATPHLPAVDLDEGDAEHLGGATRRLVHRDVVGVTVAAVVVVAHHGRGADPGDDGRDVGGDLAGVGGAQGIRGEVGEGDGSVLPPRHPRVDVAPGVPTDHAGPGVAEEAVVGDTEDRHGMRDLGLAVGRDGERMSGEVLQVGGDDLPALAAGAGEHRDRGAAIEQGGDSPARGDRLVVGVRVHEEDAL